jgi:prophage tail gpP-like protein
MAIESQVRLTVGDDDLECDVFAQYDISIDLWSPGVAFAFTIPRSNDERSAWRRVKSALKFGGPVKFSLDNSVQFTGRIEEIRTGHERGTGSVLTFAGRNLAGPAIDWDADPAVRIAGMSLGDAIAELCRVLGLSVRVGADVDQTRRVEIGTSHNARAITTRRRTQRIDRGRPQPGERIWAVMERVCARFGYMIWLAPDPDGAMSVIVDVPNYSSGTIFDLRLAYLPNGTLTSDSNIEKGGQHISIRNVPTSVTVYTNSARGASDGARFAAQLENDWIFNADVMGGYPTETTIQQPRHIRAQEARTHEAAMREAQRAVSRANAQSRRYQCTVQGHGQPLGSTGQIIHYAINCLAHVRDEEEDLDEDMLIESVHFHGGRSIGQFTELGLHARGAIQIDTETAGA